MPVISESVYNRIGFALISLRMVLTSYKVHIKALKALVLLRKIITVKFSFASSDTSSVTGISA